MSTYDEARTDTHCYHVKVWSAYGTCQDTCYATTRALLKDFALEGLTMIDVMKARNGELVILNIPLGQVLGVAEIEFIEYSKIKPIE